MPYEQRGVFYDRKRAKQLLRFDGLEYVGDVTPMDLDGLIEWHDKKRVLIEIKTKGAPVPKGERKALERMVNDFGRVGKESVAIIADHTVFNREEDVIIADCLIREIYSSREHYWRPPKRLMTIRNLLDVFLT